ncbi:MAG TPA: tail fiber domain-containing protein [Casimicrobiaceae bacterium]|jgi:hypothetical protein|nr:tail fiber domain-containing protein [Casimicrobiaceae bacterium]
MAATQSAGTAGLAPQMSIVNADGTPTVFFFRWLLNTAATAAAGAGGGNAPGDDTQVVFNAGGSLSSDPTFTFHDGSLWLSGPPGTGVAAPLFNSTAEGVEHAFQQKDGRFYVTGAGDGYFQNLIVTATFNSEATGTTAAVQQYTGTFVIFGNGNAQFQALAIAGPLTFPDGTVQITAATSGGGGGGQNQTPWLSNIDAASHSLDKLDFLQFSATGSQAILSPGALALIPQQPLYLLPKGSLFIATGSSQTTRLSIDTAGHITASAADDGGIVLAAAGKIKSSAGGFVFPDNTVQITAATGGGGSQTPWLSDIDAASHNLLNAASVGAAAGAALALKTSAISRISIDTQGHVSIGKPDGGAAASLLATDEIRITTAGANANFVIFGPQGSNRNLAFGDNANGFRWTFACDNSAESGGNIGSAFFIARWSDTGSYIDAPLYISRNDGTVTVKALYTSGQINANKLVLSSGGSVQFGDGTIQTTAATGGGSQTPWTQNINAAGFQLQNAGKIGIGTSSPASGLVVTGNASPLTALINGAIGAVQVAAADGSFPEIGFDGFGANNCGLLTFRSSNGTNAAKTASGSAQYLGQIRGYGYGATGYGALASALIGFLSTQAYSDTARGGAIAFRVIANNTVTQSEAMRIDQSGFVGIGNSSPAALLDLIGATNASIRIASALTGQPMIRLNAATSSAPPYIQFQLDDLATKSVTLCMGGVPAGGAPTSGDFVIATYPGSGGWIERFRILNTNGNVGIGQASPAVKLDIVSNDSSDSGGAIRILPANLTQSATYSFGGITGSYYFKIQSATNQYLALNGGGGPVVVGSLAIGGAAALEVGGNIRMNGTRSTIFCHGDTAGHVGGFQLLSLGSGSPMIITPTDNAGTPAAVPITLGGFGAFNSTIVGLCVSGNLAVGSNANNSLTNALVVSKNTAAPRAMSYSDGIQYVGADAQMAQMSLDSYGAQGALVNFRCAGGTNAAPAAVAASQIIGQVNAMGWNGSGYAQSACIQFVSKAAWNPSNNSTCMTFNITRLASTGIFEVMRVTEGSCVGIMTATPTYSLEIGTDLALKASTSTWQVASDLRLKRNVRNLKGGLDVIRRLRPVEAEYNGLAGTKDGQRVVSFIADEVRDVVPHAVGSSRRRLRKDDEDETDVLDLNIHEILMHAILAIQQLAGAKQLPVQEGF